MEGFYSVREMTHKLGVEAHMLRYWEKELKLNIPRDDKGHRIYGEEEARLLTLVSDYKKAGKPLKLIRTMITLPPQEEAEVGREDGLMREGTPVREDESAWEKESGPEEGTEQPLSGSQRLQDLLSRMVAQAVQESTQTMITEMKESILKELDYQFRLQGEREAELRREVVEAQEDHFQKMDVLLRNRSEERRKKLWR